MRSYLKENPLQKRAGEVAQGIGPEFKPQYQKTKQNKKTPLRPKFQVRGANRNIISRHPINLHCQLELSVLVGCRRKREKENRKKGGGSQW
jgi:hypothetical protein